MAEKEIVLCDTNIIIELFKGTSEVVNQIRSIGDSSVYISSITVAEMYYGALNKNELNKIHKRLNSIVYMLSWLLKSIVILLMPYFLLILFQP